MCRQIKIVLLTVAGFAATLAARSPTGASIIQFSDRNSWTTNVGSVDRTENFSNFQSDTWFRTQTVFANGFSLRQVGVDQGFRNFIETPPFEFGDNNGTNHASMYVNHAEGNAGTNVELIFQASIRGWGADLNQETVNEGAFIDVIGPGGQVLSTLAIPDVTNEFRGFIATAGESISKLVFRANRLDPGMGGEGFGMDNVALSVPEPGTLALLAVGGIALCRRRLLSRCPWFVESNWH